MGFCTHGKAVSLPAPGRHTSSRTIGGRCPPVSRGPRRHFAPRPPDGAWEPATAALAGSASRPPAGAAREYRESRGKTAPHPRVCHCRRSGVKLSDPPFCKMFPKTTLISPAAAFAVLHSALLCAPLPKPVLPGQGHQRGTPCYEQQGRRITSVTAVQCSSDAWL